LNQSNDINKVNLNDNTLFNKIADAILLARKQVSSTVNLVMVHTYFQIGSMIVEDEQGGEERASYGKSVLKDLSKRLTDKFSRGFSVDNLQNMRRFYLTYSKYETPSRILGNDENVFEPIRQTLSAESYNFKLSWSHYLILMKIEKLEERSFYEIEAEKQNWSESQLKRQYHSSLYERLALSRNKEEVLRLTTEGQIVDKPQDSLKNPLTLDFLGLEEKASYTESDMEHAIISKLQDFLLELGQMQMYVNYYDRFVKLDGEKPTIGILLCKKKSDALVELTLPKNANIYASEYSLYLPEKQLLQQKLSEWLSEFEDDKIN